MKSGRSRQGTGGLSGYKRRGRRHQCGLFCLPDSCLHPPPRGARRLQQPCATRSPFYREIHCHPSRARSSCGRRVGHTLLPLSLPCHCRQYRSLYRMNVVPRLPLSRCVCLSVGLFLPVCQILSPCLSDSLSLSLSLSLPPPPSPSTLCDEVIH